MSSASIYVVEGFGGSRMTIVVRTAEVVVVGRSATWKVCMVWSAAGNWVKGSPIKKCPGDRYVVCWVEGIIG